MGKSFPWLRCLRCHSCRRAGDLHHGKITSTGPSSTKTCNSQKTGAAPPLLHLCSPRAPLLCFTGRMGMVLFANAGSDRNLALHQH